MAFVSRLLLLTSALIPLAALQAQAQATGTTPLATSATSASAGASGSEQVVVTGSRLKTSNLTSEAPITVITSKQIAQSSAQTIEDVLRKIPSIGTNGLYGTNNNGGVGASCIDLRNLGINRTLVLVDGRRFVHTGFGDGADCVDLGTIPIATIDRIEILKDGSSTIYGADAIAGVINIITKKNYTGTQINLGGDISASGDRLEGDIAGTTGFDFAQGRGNVALSGSYLDRGAIEQKSRDWAVPSISADNGPNAPLTYGSSYTPGGQVFGSTSGTAYGTVQNGTLTPFTRADRYDYGADQYLDARVKQANLSASTHYDVNPHLTLYGSAYYTHKETETQLAGNPIYANADGTQFFDIPAGNPYAKALGLNEQVYEYRRMSDWGPRQYRTATDARQGTVGARGNIVGNWDYDAYYTYGRSTNTIELDNMTNFNKLEQEVGYRNTDPNDPNVGVYDPSVCAAQAGCVLANPFGAGSFSQAAINYASYKSVSQAIYQFRDLGATITNNKVLQLPYGPLGLAIGMEHRGEDGAYHPDPTDATLTASDAATGGGFNVTEAFGELSIPILRNLPFAKDLSADISGRFSDYNTFGSVENWKAGLNWTPVRDIRFRANIGSATRQPAIEELFGGQTTGYPSATDPCDAGQVGSYGALSGLVASNCARKISGYSSTGFTQATAGQTEAYSGGNAKLLPETARTYTIGTVITPRWIPGLSATVDYWHTKIANSINTLTAQYVLDSCYQSVDFTSPMCGYIANRSSNGQLSTINLYYENLGETRTSGIDFDLNYTLRLRGGHMLSLSNSLTDTIAYLAQQVPNGPFLNEKGRLISGLYGVAYPVIRDNMTATYAKDRFSFSWTVRYIDHMTVNDGITDLTAETSRYYKTNEVFYHDIMATYNWHKVQFIGGIDNLFDKTPPLVVDGTTNTDPSVYDVVGRYFYAKAQIRF